MSQLAQILVRSVVRAFYDVEHVVVVDALAIHSAYVSCSCDVGILFFIFIYFCG